MMIQSYPEEISLALGEAVLDIVQKARRYREKTWRER